MSRTQTIWIVIGVACLALSFAAQSVLPDYIVRIITITAINALLVASMALANGMTGVFSLGHVGFVAIGAYAAGILSLPLAQKASLLPNLPGWLSGWYLSFLPSTIAAGVAAAAVAVLVGAPLLRLSGHFVSVATLGFLVIVNEILINADSFTRGARTFTGVPLETTLPWAIGWLVVGLIALGRISASPTGRAWRATREDVLAAKAIGIETQPTRLSAFVIGAFFAGVGGSLYAHYLGSFSPKSFFFAYTFTLISMLVVGGMGSLSGAVTGTVVVTALSEVLRNLERGLDLGVFSIPPLYGASQIALGLLFIAIMILRPEGLMGPREIDFRNGQSPGPLKETS